MNSFLQLILSIVPLAPIATVIGVFVASYAIYNNTQNARKKATLDMLIFEKNNKELQDSITKVNELSKIENGILSAYLSNDKDAKKDILRVLNQREFVANAILCGVLHEKMYKKSSYSIFIRDWHNLEVFVINFRKRDKVPATVFQEFQTLAKKWQKKPLKQKH